MFYHNYKTFSHKSRKNKCIFLNRYFLVTFEVIHGDVLNNNICKMAVKLIEINALVF